MGKATNSKFGRYIYKVHPSKSPLKNFEQKDRGRIQGLSNFLGVPPIISLTGKATDFKFGRYTYRVHPSKSPLKIFRWRLETLQHKDEEIEKHLEATDAMACSVAEKLLSLASMTVTSTASSSRLCKTAIMEKNFACLILAVCLFVRLGGDGKPTTRAHAGVASPAMCMPHLHVQCFGR